MKKTNFLAKGVSLFVICTHDNNMKICFTRKALLKK